MFDQIKDWFQSHPTLLWIIFAIGSIKIMQWSLNLLFFINRNCLRCSSPKRFMTKYGR